jgi:ABC-type bacteriocin/lantibiotic exporter with double-glycine peptidase domain
LSEGQIQKIGLARALYGSLNILILDELTSSLNNETDIRTINHMNALTNK